MTQMILELPERNIVNSIMGALEAYKLKLQASINFTKQKLMDFEKRYGVSTDYFLQKMAAEDLEGGDLEYVEWAGEAKLLERLELELQDIERVHFELR